MDALSARLRPVAGVRVGHWTDSEARTGCTVVRFDRPTLTAVDVRGAAPGSRELDLLRPGQLVQRPDAILLTGGSAMGLAAADGVVRWLRERGRGFTTPAGPVPIVPAAVIFDLSTGHPSWPDADAGHAAADGAVPLDELQVGQVGAGTGATVGAIAGPAGRRTGGLGAAQVDLDEGTVTAIVVLNAFGMPRQDDADPRVGFLGAREPAPTGESTSLLACVTDLPLDHGALMRMTVAMHDGLARSIVPVHTIADGDIAFASTVNDTPGNSPEQTMRASLAAEIAVERAIAVAIPRTRSVPSV